MFYVKNISTKARLLRFVAAAATIACGLIGLQGLAVGYLLACVGFLTGLTAVFGFCPACFMVGRRLKRE